MCGFLAIQKELQRCTQFWSRRPFGVGLLVAGYDVCQRTGRATSVCVCACVCACVCVCVCVCVVGWLVGFPSFLSLLFPPPLFLLILTTHFFFHLLAMALSSSASSFLCTRAPTPLSPLLLTAVRPGKRAARVRGAAFGQLL